MTDPGTNLTTDGPVTTVTVWWQVHVLLGGLGLAAGLVLRAPVLVVLAAPSVLLVVAAMTWHPGAPPTVAIEVDGLRLVSGDTTRAVLTLTAPRRLGVAVRVPVTGPLDTEDPTRRVVALRPGQPADVELTLRAGRWGAARIGPAELRWHSPGHLVRASAVAEAHALVRVLPRTPAARRLPRPRATHAATGVVRSRASGSGTEFADLRPFSPGDRARDVSPHVSARRGEPWVVHRHPDRRTDVVLLLDAFDEHELDDVLAAARAIARGHLRAGDRVGVTTMTGVPRWLPPGEGPRHEHRIAAALVDARITHSWVRPAVEQLPRRVLPPGALVLGITPATDPRLADTAVALRLRGWDVAVLIATPPVDGDDAVVVAAQRLVRLERRAVRDRLQGNGVPAVDWDPTTTVDTALDRLATWRRRTASGRRGP